jgi:hypothetical protein
MHLIDYALEMHIKGSIKQYKQNIPKIVGSIFHKLLPSEWNLSFCVFKGCSMALIYSFPQNTFTPQYTRHPTICRPHKRRLFGLGQCSIRVPKKLPINGFHPKWTLYWVPIACGNGYG